jgi:SNF2 family DNA or RNA helicase
MIYLTDAGGESINLQRGKHIVMISRPWAPGTYRQIVGRARRLGSKHTSILIWHLTCSDTIDEYVDSLLAKKFGPVEDIIQGRGALLPDDQVLPLEIADYARQKRKQKGRISL